MAETATATPKASDTPIKKVNAPNAPITTDVKSNRATPITKPEQPDKGGLSSVSQLKYWLEGEKYGNNNDGKDGATYLSYNVFLILSILGGFFALDHLYLRSPTTFVAKFATNLFFFGVWWIWDICQALFNEPVVRIYGLGVPGMGPQGIGAGVLVEEQPNKKHLRFFTYAIALIFGGIIGLDSFLLGQNEMGIFRLIATVSFVLLPISMIEWGYKLYQFFFNTKAVVGQNAEYFGAAGGFDISGWLTSFLYKIFGPFIEPFNKALDAYNKTLDVVDTTIKTGSTIVESVGKVVDAASASGKLLPATSLYSAVTAPALKEAQKGGSQDIKLLPYTVLGTVLLIFGSGLYKNFTKKDVKDDSPPQPRAV